MMHTFKRFKRQSLPCLLSGLLILCLLIFTACSSYPTGGEGTGTGEGGFDISGGETATALGPRPGDAPGGADGTGPDGSRPGGEIPGMSGGATSASTPEETKEVLSDAVRELVGTLPAGLTVVPDGATHITGKITITEPGDYYVDGEIDGKKIVIDCEGVTLYLVNATLSNQKKVIESNHSFTLTLIGRSTIQNSNADGSNAIDCTGTLTINGRGSLSVTSTKNAIVADSLLIRDAELYLYAQKDGLHAEISAYDEDTVTVAPTFSYADGGYVVLDGAYVTIESDSDGIQADTFVYVTNRAFVSIRSGGGAPGLVTETSSDNASGKGIKAGAIDWGAKNADGERAELADGDYLILIENATVSVDANDDAIHSDGSVVLLGATLTLASGDDGVHADKLLRIADGASVTVTKSYEGLEGAKVEILETSDRDGTAGQTTILVVAVDDGINAADGSQTQVNVSNPNCHILITGGVVSVDAGGDGLDSNGTLRITGGCVYVSGSTSGADSALDADGGILLDGGYVFAVSSSGMVEAPASNSTQCAAVLSAVGGISAGMSLSLVDQTGEVLFSYTVPKAGQAVIVSSPELTVGATYRLMVGETELASFVQSTAIIGSSTGGMGGGMPGGMGGRPDGMPGRPGDMDDEMPREP